MVQYTLIISHVMRQARSVFHKGIPCLTPDVNSALNQKTNLLEEIQLPQLLPRLTQLDLRTQIESLVKYVMKFDQHISRCQIKIFV